MKILTYIKTKKKPLSNIYKVFLYFNRSSIKEDYENSNWKFSNKKELSKIAETKSIL